MEFELLAGPGSPEDFLFTPTAFLRPKQVDLTHALPKKLLDRSQIPVDANVVMALR